MDCSVTAVFSSFEIYLFQQVQLETALIHIAIIIYIVY